MNYPYANGVIKAIEGNLFDKSKYAKLIKTEKSEFVSTLASLGYGNGTDRDQLIDIINAELVTLKRLLEGISPQRHFTDLFYMTYDAMNLKVLYKEKCFAVPRPDILVDTGAMDEVLLTSAVMTGDFSALPPEYLRLLTRIDTAAPSIDNPRKLSAFIDDEVFAFVFKAIKGPQAGTLRAYYKAFVDFANVITLMRSRVLCWDYETFADMVVQGGAVSFAVFTEAYPLQGDALARVFMDYYQEKITLSIKQYNETQDLDRLERTFDTLTIEIISEYRFDAFGIGPIIYYYLKKLAEAKNIRRIYANSSTDLADLL